MVPCQCVRQVVRRGLHSYALSLSARQGASGGQHLCLVRLLGRCEEARGVVRGVGGRLRSPSATTTTAMDNTHHTRFLRTPPSAFDNARVTHERTPSGCCLNPTSAPRTTTAMDDTHQRIDVPALYIYQDSRDSPACPPSLCVPTLVRTRLARPLAGR